MQRTNEQDAAVRAERIRLAKDLIALFSNLPEEKQRRVIEQIRSGFIEEYLQAIDAVKKRKNLPTDEKLKQLLAPLIGYNKLDPFSNPIPFIDESVDIERELDIENLRYDEERYQLYDEKGDQTDASGVHGLVTSSSYIFVREKFDSDLENYRKMEVVGRDGFSSVFDLGKISLRDLHKEWLPSLNQKTIKSRDLLDQVLVAYTIKQAQNEDEKAIQKLYDLYKGAAEALAVKFAKMFGMLQEIKDLKSDVQLLLMFLITGFRPEDIISQLVGPNSEEVIKAIPPWVKNFYIYYLAEYIPQRMEKNIRQTQRNQDQITELAKLPDDGGRNQGEEIGFLKARNASLDLQWIGIFNPYTPIQADTLWKTPKRINRFNSYSFRPGLVKMGPRRNLTTWLFGHKNEIGNPAKSKRKDGYRAKTWQPYGKLYQLLRDKYKPMIEEKKGYITTDDAEDNFNEEHTEKLDYKEKKKVPFSHFWNPPNAPEQKSRKWRAKPSKKSPFTKSLKEIVDELKKMGTSARDAEIFARCKILKQITQKEIAMQRGLSRRQVIRICQKVNTLISSK